MAWYDPGKKVVCIKRGPWARVITGERCLDHNPTYGEICTVLDWHIHPLAGMKAIWIAGYGELHHLGYSYDLRRFRPLDDASKKADRGMETFRPHLKGAKQPVGEDA